MTKPHSLHDHILILDFGSQVTQLIARRLRESGVYCEIWPFNHIEEDKVKVRVLYASPGEITETDVDFADASKSTILAFNTSLAPGAKKTARHLGVEIKEQEKDKNMMFKP